jgi:hypothetical protein
MENLSRMDHASSLSRFSVNRDEMRHILDWASRFVSGKILESENDMSWSALRCYAF